MGATKISVNKQSQAIPRTGFSYDPSHRGFDASFWDTITGTPSISSGNIRLNVATIVSYTQFKYGVFRIRLNVPTTPSAGEAKQWGLLLPAAPTIGAAYFEITGTTFRAVSFDEDGTTQTTNITWSAGVWDGNQIVYEIEWEEDYVIFKVAGVALATHQTRVGRVPLPVYILNADADNTDVDYVTIKETAQYV